MNDTVGTFTPLLGETITVLCEFSGLLCNVCCGCVSQAAFKDRPDVAAEGLSFLASVARYTAIARLILHHLADATVPMKTCMQYPLVSFEGMRLLANLAAETSNHGAIMVHVSKRVWGGMLLSHSCPCSIPP